MTIQLISFSLFIIFLYMNVMFILAQMKKDNSIVDIGWGIGFLLVSVSLMAKTGGGGLTHILFLIMLAIWAIRLASYIFVRNRGTGEDYRYAAWRKEWGKNVVWRAYLQVFMLQGLIMAIVLSPAYAMFSMTEAEFEVQHMIGFLIWGVGFYFEALGDAQMKKFKADPANKGRVMNSGLWRYTRHPNYFGEAVLWFGLGVFSIHPDHWWLSFIGPLVITFFLLKVSGVAMLERKYEGNTKYAEYRRTTNAFVPWFPSE